MYYNSVQGRNLTGISVITDTSLVPWSQSRICQSLHTQYCQCNLACVIYKMSIKWHHIGNIEHTAGTGVNEDALCRAMINLALRYGHTSSVVCVFHLNCGQSAPSPLRIFHTKRVLLSMQPNVYTGRKWRVQIGTQYLKDLVLSPSPQQEF